MLIVLALPEWGEGDAQRLQAWRLKHQPTALLLPAHVSLVEHEHAMADQDLIDHVRRVAASLAPFPLELTYALPLMWDGQRARVLLMPEAGGSALWRLYRALYSGQLAAWIPTTSLYLPHVALGTFSMPQMALAVADQWNAQEPPLRGEVNELQVARVTAAGLRWVTEIPLTGARPA